MQRWGKPINGAQLMSIDADCTDDTPPRPAIEYDGVSPPIPTIAFAFARREATVKEHL